jgi:preprotein translocase subunit SecB
VFAKRKRQDAVFRVKTAPRASADPLLIQDCFAGCEAHSQQTVFAKRKRQDAVFRVKTAPRASADPLLVQDCVAVAFLDR